VSDGVPAILAR